MMEFKREAGSFLVFILIFLPAFTFAAAEVNEVNKEYYIGPENVLSISVYYGKEESLKQRIRVSSGGFITFPLLGDIDVSGMTVRQLEDKLTALLKKDYFVNPQASVFVEEYSTVSVLGEVAHPGAYPIKGKLSVVELISLAGGFTKIAAPNKVKIIRNRPDGRKQEIRVKVADITLKGRKDEDVFLKEGDIVIVAQSLF